MRDESAQIETTLCAIAAKSDCEDGALDGEIALLAERGWLRACLPTRFGGEGWGSEQAGTLAGFDALRVLGCANLSVARLFEGHMNAVKLVALYGSEQMQSDMARKVDGGDLLGVWGADAPQQGLQYTKNDGKLQLKGAKRFASGLGLVSHAVVTTGTDNGPQMLLVPTDCADRCDRSAWSMGGMRATQSGKYDFSGIEIETGALLGEPEDYFREPHFEGGIWRYCAAHLGAIEALYAEMLGRLTERDRAGDSNQQRRIVSAAIDIETVRLWLLRVAQSVEVAGAAPEKAALSLLARQVTEDACRRVVETVERALGMDVHVEGSFLHRTMHDLRLFLCQAAPDAKRGRAATTLIEHDARPEQL